MEIAFALPADIGEEVWLSDAESASWPSLSEEKHLARLLGRIAAKKAVIRYLERAGVTCAPISVVVSNGTLGVPFISIDAVIQDDIRISLSHESTLAVAAVGEMTERSFGVDVERIRSFDDRFPGDFLSPEEQRAISTLPAADQSRAVTRHWSLKEACLKALGTGLREHPHTLTVRSIAEGKYGIFRGDRLIGEGEELSVPTEGRIAVIVHLSE